MSGKSTDHEASAPERAAFLTTAPRGTAVRNRRHGRAGDAVRRQERSLARRRCGHNERAGRGYPYAPPGSSWRHSALGSPLSPAERARRLGSPGSPSIVDVARPPPWSGGDAQRSGWLLPRAPLASNLDVRGVRDVLRGRPPSWPPGRGVLPHPLAAPMRSRASRPTVRRSIRCAGAIRPANDRAPLVPPPRCRRR